MSNVKIEIKKINFSYIVRKNISLKKKLLNITPKIGKKINYREQKIKVFDNFSLNISAGERIGIIGLNGTGKTTLLKLINNLYVPDNGTIVVNGKIASLISLTSGMNMFATGLENIFIKGCYLGYSRDHIKKNLANIISFSELGNYLHLPTNTYSSGMILRLNFSIITQFDVDIIIMDEWLSLGDENFKKKAYIRLNSFVKRASILLITSQNKENIKNIKNIKFLQLKNI